MSEKDVISSPYNYVLNNPLRLIDPNGLYWLNSSDGDFAGHLEDLLSQGMAKDRKSLSDVISDLAKNGLKDRDIKKLNEKLSEITDHLELLSESFDALKTMELTASMGFTFEKVAGTEGSTSDPINGVITMQYVNNANAIHETTHGLQKFTGPTTTENFLDYETSAYKHQYAFDPGSVRNNAFSYYGYVNSIKDISNNWVLGLNTNSNFSGEFKYAKILFNNTGTNQVYSNDWVKEILDTMKKQEKK